MKLCLALLRAVLHLNIFLCSVGTGYVCDDTGFSYSFNF